MQLRWWLLSVLLLGSTTASAENEYRLALLPLDLSQLELRLSPAAVSALDEAFREDIAQTLPPNWKLVGAAETLRAMAEAGLNPADCNSPICHHHTALALHASKYMSLSLVSASDGVVLGILVNESREGRVIVTEQVTSSLRGLPAAFAAKLKEIFQRASILSFNEAPKVAEKPKVKIRRNRVEPRTRLEFAYFQGGSFQPGCEPKDELCFSDEKDLKEVQLGEFWLAKTEVPTKVYEQCVQAGVCSAAVSNGLGGDRCNWNRRPDHPINCLRFEQAREFCRWIGGDLPTADEWEFAAKDGGGRIYPWGADEPTPELAVIQTGDTVAVGQRKKGASPAGVFDLVGNVAEWTTSTSELHNHRQIRGGTFDSETKWLRPSARASSDADQGQDAIGFRCRLPVTKER